MIVLATAGFTFTQSNRNAGSEYVAHEWGTFTSVQASDGALLNWQGVAPAELPAFVYSWSRPGLVRMAFPNLSKSEMALQRMETPVIYFYGGQGQKVDLTVRFPKGKITEWYPQPKDVGPSLPGSIWSCSMPMTATNATEDSLIRWVFNLLPQQNSSQAALPVEKSGNHYFAARETDSAVLRVDPSEESQISTEYEKFLFYRGIGEFETPLKVTMNAGGEITLANTGPEVLKDLFLLGVEKGSGNFLHVSKLAPRETQTFRLDLEKHAMPLSKLGAQLSSDLAKALTSRGLFP
ncbi:MAG: hypothetical protein ABIV39_09245, partial [Verrucomicrobiota bacterium]